MPAAIIIQLVQMVIAFLLQLFNRNPVAVTAYINGDDTNSFFRPFVVASRKRRLKAFVTAFAITKGVSPTEAYTAVVAKLQSMDADAVKTMADSLPA